MKHWINAHYGSRRGLAKFYWFKLLYLTGGFRTYRQVDWQSVHRLVFVCKGNICRSAFAEVVASSQAVESVSCGIETVDDAPADENAIQAAERRGFDLRDHRTTPIQNLSVGKNDLLVAMEPWQVKYIEQEYGRSNMCTLLGLWGSNANPYIHDPFLSAEAYFNTCFSSIEDSVDEITRKINNNS